MLLVQKQCVQLIEFESRDEGWPIENVLFHDLYITAALLSSMQEEYEGQIIFDFHFVKIAAFCTSSFIAQLQTRQS